MTAPALDALVAQVTASSACDALMKRGERRFMHSRIRPLARSRVAGPALTVERVPAAGHAGPTRPNADFLAAVESAPAGTVLVFNGTTGVEAALWGGLLAMVAAKRGLGGVVADGPVRDPGEITDVGCACFCTGAVPAGQAGLLVLASIGEPIACGGVAVRTGDFVLGDDSGVVVIPRGDEHAILAEAAVIERRDQAAMAMLRDGRSLTETMRALGRE